MDASLASRIIKSMVGGNVSTALIELFKPQLTDTANSFTPIILTQHFGYSYAILGVTGIFQKINVEKAPSDFQDSLVFMDYAGEYTVLIRFRRVDEYVICTSNYVMPVPADDFFDEYVGIFLDQYELDVSDYTRIISGSEISGMISK